MGMWDAPSDLDYYDECHHEPRGEQFVCPTCGDTFLVSRSEAYPGPRPLCENCAYSAWVDAKERDVLAKKGAA